jgi:hypothetical protein
MSGWKFRRMTDESRRLIFWTVFKVNVYVIFLWWRAPQHEVRTHRSIKVYCATFVMKIKRKIISFFFIFPSNGTPVEWNWQGKTEVLGENPSQCHFVRHKSHTDWPRIELTCFDGQQNYLSMYPGQQKNRHLYWRSVKGKQILGSLRNQLNILLLRLKD